MWVIAVSSARAQQSQSVFDAVTECDLLAAHPDDPQRMAEGVADDVIVPRLAIQACKDAIEADKNNVQLIFQLGRALLAANLASQAKEQLSIAEQRGHAAAAAYLGDIYQFGLTGERSATKALQFYRKAVELGFLVARDQIRQLTFDPNMYVSAAIHYLFEGNFLTLKRDIELPKDESTEAAREKALQARALRNYLYNFVLIVVENCDNVLKTPIVSKFYQFRYPSGWQPDQEDHIRIAINTSLGERDAQQFLGRHGCEGPVAKSMFTQFNVFFEDAGR